MKTKIFDSHTHTVNSRDGKQTIDELCCSAITKGVSGVAVTDHANMHTYIEYGIHDRMISSIADVERARDRFGDRLNVFLGVELGEYLYDMRCAEDLLSLADYDVVLGTLHFIDFPDGARNYTGISYDISVPYETIKEHLKLYFSQMYDIVDRGEMDVLAHLTCPLRYINKKYKRAFDISVFNAEIRDIFSRMISRGIALEVNTSAFGTDHEDILMPDENILSLYRGLGGEMITLGSDAHSQERVAFEFSRALGVLRKIGFEHYYYFKSRKAYKTAL